MVDCVFYFIERKRSGQMNVIEIYNVCVCDSVFLMLVGVVYDGILLSVNELNFVAFIIIDSMIYMVCFVVFYKQ